MQVSQVKTQRSDGTTVLTQSTYPGDYRNVSAGPLLQMRTNAFFQHSAVIESTTQTYPAGQPVANAKTIGGTYTEYVQPGASQRYVPATTRALELAGPTAGLVPAAPSSPVTGRYALQTQFTYDPVAGNVQQIQRPQGTPTVYLWGYQHTLPVASVQNASATQVQAALTALNVDLNTLSTEADLRTAFAQLRAQLPKAQIIGMTYDPLVGMTSQTDPTGRTTTYEYDALGRLLRVRDEQGRLVKANEYHYARP